MKIYFNTTLIFSIALSCLLLGFGSVFLTIEDFQDTDFSSINLKSYSSEVKFPDSYKSIRNFISDSRLEDSQSMQDAINELDKTDVTNIKSAIAIVKTSDGNLGHQTYEIKSNTKSDDSHYQKYKIQSVSNQNEEHNNKSASQHIYTSTSSQDNATFGFLSLNSHKGSNPIASNVFADNAVSSTTDLTDKYGPMSAPADPNDPGAGVPVGDGVWLLLLFSVLYGVKKFFYSPSYCA